MKLIKDTLNSLIILLAAGTLINTSVLGYGGEGTKNKAEKISKFKTQELINYVNLTIYYLYSAENKNERHVILFKSCQKLLNSNKKTVKGKDKKNLTSCTNLMNMGTYKNQSSISTKDKTQDNVNKAVEAEAIRNAEADAKRKARREAEAAARREAESTIEIRPRSTIDIKPSKKRESELYLY